LIYGKSDVEISKQIDRVETVGIKGIKKIIDVLLETRGVDFSNYASSSFRRRIARFIEINKIRDFDKFIESLRENKSFGDNLIKEITVNVTEMFRDPSFWIALRQNILPQISTNSEINIWHAACSTGEEVYSMAILLHEAGLLRKTKIVATDLNSDVIKIAKEGVYQLKNQEVNTKNYEHFGGESKLSSYYEVIGNNVQYDQQLTANVDFMTHNLSQDGPFSNFDLIICRNVLIYFNFELQEKVIKTFEKSLSKGSFLGIGSKESISWCKASRFFKAEINEENIYKKVTDIERLHHIIR
jgi:chemotaxis protein methyltransferase CheR